jgi:hypothetical protein
MESTDLLEYIVDFLFVDVDQLDDYKNVVQHLPTQFRQNRGNPRLSKNSKDIYRVVNLQLVNKTFRRVVFQKLTKNIDNRKFPTYYDFLIYTKLIVGVSRYDLDRVARFLCVCKTFHEFRRTRPNLVDHYDMYLSKHGHYSNLLEFKRSCKRKKQKKKESFEAFVKNNTKFIPALVKRYSEKYRKQMEVRLNSSRYTSRRGYLDPIYKFEKYLIALGTSI